jgi:hypothetical protein
MSHVVTQKTVRKFLTYADKVRILDKAQQYEAGNTSWFKCTAAWLASADCPEDLRSKGVVLKRPTFDGAQLSF